MNEVAGLEDAVAIAAQAHRGQKDKAGAPYLLHPLRMMLRMRSETAMMAAVLHDVVEDTDWTLEGLRERGFPEEVPGRQYEPTCPCTSCLVITATRALRSLACSASERRRLLMPRLFAAPRRGFIFTLPPAKKTEVSVAKRASQRASYVCL